MRALIRNDEIYKEEAWSPFTQNHIDWKSTAYPQGDGFALAEDCPDDAIPSDFDITSAEVATEQTAEDGNGAEYHITVTRLTATLNAERYSARIASEQTE